MSRRAFLTGLTGAATLGTAGCLDHLQASVSRNRPEQVSLSVKTVPRDEDEVSIGIAHHLAENLERAGANVDLEPLGSEQLLREVLINREFDIYVGQHPGHVDPDYLYAFFHSRFVEEAGWQNPSGYANIVPGDESLEDQRTASGDHRDDILADIQESIVRDCPIAVIAFPEETRAMRSDRYVGWTDHSFENPLSYVGLRAVDDPASDGGDDTLRVGITDQRITRNRNPFAVEFRDRGIFTGLLYDPLGRHVEGAIEPWLAESWEWTGTDRSTLSLTLRDGLEWHDGESLTATDVKFTYRFLQDTTMTDEVPAVPAPRFRGRSALVNAVDVYSDRDFVIRFAPSSHTAALRALSVPIVPEHVWEERTDIAELAGIDLDHVTEALIWDNPEPVGSGPLRFVDATAGERLELARFDDHFLREGSVDGATADFEGGPAYRRIEFTFSPSDATMVEALAAGDLDAMAQGLHPSEISRAENAEGVTLDTERTSAYYHVGFNNRNAPLSNPQFRIAVSRLIDRDHLHSEVFDRYATPALSPLFDTESVPPELRWEEGHDLGFGGGEDGEIDPETARELFRDAGYRYNGDDELITR